ncbi:type II secretion system F family protein [Isoptericola variabilis]|uniref:Type II secretion system F domain protein n=1 Tax=Isoptericola variabilis (strain 225) TaxID=743718 RepID=F6FTJ2_ISOV2|nr:type II secretion system F family protein [Isoptericola variabilis]AEG43185.1 Type II secretion system F domain protein [Isoptericola variabilis 225]TWH35118.1 Flp pilus assembly protein TadC [Isoptericola variabilis J7]
MSVGVVVALLALVAASPWWWADHAARRRTATVAVAPPPGPGPSHAAVAVPVLLELVAAAVRSGAGVPRALRATGDAVGGPDGAALARAADALRLGADWDTAWREAPARLDVVRRALRGAWADGAAPTEALRAAGAEHAHERRSAARTAAGRLAVRLVLPLGACFLPAFVLVGLVPVLLALGVDLLST